MTPEDYSALFRIAMYVTPTAMAMLCFRRYWFVVLIGLVLIALGVLVIFEVDPVIRGYISIPAAAGISWLMWDRLRSDPQHLHDLIARREAEWSQRRHEMRGELAIERSHARLLRRRLDEAGVDHGDIPNPACPDERAQ